MIRFRHVGVSFGSSQGPTEALYDLNLEMGRELFGILGPSGCGKSTLLRVLAGLVKPTAGSVEFEGSGGSYGIVFQDYSLLPWLTARENIELGLRLQRLPKAETAMISARYLTDLNLQDTGHLLPHQLSGGMRQRVAIARAFAPNPDLLLMDEPFGALDAITREELQMALTTLYESEPRTIVFVTHDVDEALLLCDRICVLTPRPGQVKEVFRVPFDRPRRPDVKRDHTFQELKTETEDLLRRSTPLPSAIVLQNR